VSSVAYLNCMYCTLSSNNKSSVSLMMINMQNDGKQIIYLLHYAQYHII
jgi:hypothetical protein